MTPVRALRGESSARGLKRGRLPLEKSSGNLTAALAFKSMLSDFRHSLMIFIIVTAVSFAGAFGVIMYYNTSMDTTAFAEVPGVEICNAVAILNPQTNNTETAREIEGMEHVRKVLFLDTVRLRIDGAEVSSYVMADYAEKETMSVYEGKYPEQSGEITLAGVFAQRLNKKVGDQVTAEYGDQTQVFTVTGLSSGSAMAGLTVNILTEDFERLNPVFSPSSLNVYLEDGADAAVFIEDLENSLSDDQLISAGDFDKMMSEGMMSYQSIIAALGLSMLVVTLAVITLVLYFIIGSSVVRRKQELGIQKALGFVTVQLMNQIAVGFSLPVALGVAVGCTFSALCTNPVMSVVMAGIGVMNANFAVNTLWVAAFGVGCFIFSYLVSLAVTARIRKISAYALVTGTAG